jgi:hypothetical protein
VTASPLFLESQLRPHLRRLVGYPEALLVVSGLEDVYPNRRRSPRARDAYRESVLQIRATAARFAAPGSRLTLILI